MSFYCPHGPTKHQHNTVGEAHDCYRGRTMPSPAPVESSSKAVTPPVPPEPVPAFRHFTPLTEAQLHHIVNNLGGDGTYAMKLSKRQASNYIVQLSEEKKKREAMSDPRLDLLKGMLDMIPDGYYATQIEDGATVNFLRLSRPTKGEFKDCVKIQTQHSEVWQNRMILWPSGKWSVYDQRVIEMVMLIMADYRTCARRYSIELQACCRCNTELTDDRSRHYLIGPVCDKKAGWQWVIEEVDDKNDGLSYEDLVSRGLPTRVWQDRAFA